MDRELNPPQGQWWADAHTGDPQEYAKAVWEELAAPLRAANGWIAVWRTYWSLLSERYRLMRQITALNEEVVRRHARAASLAATARDYLEEAEERADEEVGESIKHEPSREALERSGVDPALIDEYGCSVTLDKELTWEEAVEQVLNRAEQAQEEVRRGLGTVWRLTLRAMMAKNVFTEHRATGTVHHLSDAAAETLVGEAKAAVPTITGYRAGEYAPDVLAAYEAHPGISTFSALKGQPCYCGESKVDTVKRGIGYKDLPTDQKTFPNFIKMLREAVNSQ